jgi:hypothetical protein
MQDVGVLGVQLKEKLKRQVLLNGTRLYLLGMSNVFCSVAVAIFASRVDVWVEKGSQKR